RLTATRRCVFDPLREPSRNSATSALRWYLLETAIPSLRHRSKYLNTPFDSNRVSWRAGDRDRGSNQRGHGTGDVLSRGPPCSRQATSGWIGLAAISQSRYMVVEL